MDEDEPSDSCSYLYSLLPTLDVNWVAIPFVCGSSSTPSPSSPSSPPPPPQQSLDPLRKGLLSDFAERDEEMDKARAAASSVSSPRFPSSLLCHPPHSLTPRSHPFSPRKHYCSPAPPTTPPANAAKLRCIILQSSPEPRDATTFLLRKRRMYAQTWAYSVAPLLDLVLRFTWTLSLIPVFSDNSPLGPAFAAALTPLLAVLEIGELFVFFVCLCLCLCC